MITETVICVTCSVVFASLALWGILARGPRPLVPMDNAVDYRTTCDVCNRDTALDHTGVYIEVHTKTRRQTLTVLCIDCYANGIRWAARKGQQ